MQAPAPPGSAPSATFRVQCAGLVKQSADGAGGANPVLNVLRGMCVRYESFERPEFGFSLPLQSGTASVSLKLFQHKAPSSSVPNAANPFAPPPPPLWTLVHESTPLRGPVYASLPAAVREVTESNIYSPNAREFLEALGARMEYMIVKTGNYYVCNHGGIEIQVMVYAVVGCSRAGVRTSNMLGKNWMIEAAAEAGPERQVEVARLMGSFAERLLPHVELMNPM